MALWNLARLGARFTRTSAEFKAVKKRNSRLKSNLELVFKDFKKPKSAYFWLAKSWNSAKACRRNLKFRAFVKITRLARQR